MSQGLDFPGAAQGRKRRETARCPTLGSASHTSETERRWESGKRTERGCSLRGERPAVLEEEPESNTALIPDIEARAGIPGSGAQPANSERGFPRSHSGLTSATVPPRSVSTVTGWRQSSALLLIISLYGINIRI